jgi:hypothetical protein
VASFKWFDDKSEAKPVIETVVRTPIIAITVRSSTREKAFRFRRGSLIDGTMAIMEI